LPGLRNVLVLTTLLAFIWTFNYFDLAYAMTQGGPGTATTTIAFDIYKTSFIYNRFDQGAALSVVSFVLMAVAIGAYAWASRRRHG
jgi:ABC-type sugar transport system permease subunit